MISAGRPSLVLRASMHAHVVVKRSLDSRVPRLLRKLDGVDLGEALELEDLFDARGRTDARKSGSC